MVFHEITKEAISARSTDRATSTSALVDAQETRRILDRLYGYEVSPVLWKKITPRPLGRSRAVGRDPPRRRARARADAFAAASWWDLEATFDPGAFEARLVPSTAGASRRDATSARRAARRATRCSSTRRRARPARRLQADFVVRSSERQKPYTRRPSPPFMTSTLQQEASRKLRFSAQTTMRVAQRLYENGYITYMRTDSTTLSERRSPPPARRRASSTATSTSRRAAPLRAQGEERAGGARGDPPPRVTRSAHRSNCSASSRSDEHALYELI
jgi:DNA topoisomerase-1